MTAKQKNVLRCALPEQISEIPLDDDPSRRAELRRQGVVYRGTFVARSDAESGKPVIARFGILVKDVESREDRPLAGLATALVARGEPREITFEEFPAGEALFVEEQVAESARPARQAQVIFAAPDGLRIAIIGLFTENLADWPDFVRLLKNMASSVSFAEVAHHGGS